MAAACEALGLDVFKVANEGKMLIIVAPEDASRALGLIRGSRYGAEARIIGEVRDKPPGRVPSAPASAPAASWTPPPATCCRGSVSKDLGEARDFIPALPQTPSPTRHK